MRSAPGIALFLLVHVLCGCAHSGSRPGWERVRDSALDAVKDGSVWMPLAGAGLLAIGDADRKVSDWAIEHRPLFGSRQSADDASDRMAGTLLLGGLVTGLAVPQERGSLRATRVVAQGLIVAANHFATAVVKNEVRRSRPDGSNDDSFPSRHSSGAFAAATLLSDNLDHFDWTERRRRYTSAAAMALAATTAWARVEGGYHYPSDVLAGAALGSFTARFLARLLCEPGANLAIQLQPLPGGGLVSVSYRIASR